MFKQNKMSQQGVFNNNEILRTTLKKRLLRPVDEWFLAYREEYEKCSRIGVEQKKRMLLAEAQIMADRLHFTEEEKQIYPIPLEKELRWVEEQRQKSKLVFDQFLAGLTESEKHNRETTYFQDGDPKLSVLDVGGEWCLEIGFTTYHKDQINSCTGFDRKSSDRLISLLLANMQVDKKGFVFSKNNRVFSAIELIINEQTLLSYGSDINGDDVAYNQNYLICTGTPYRKTAKELVSKNIFPVHRVKIDHDFSVVYQPRYTNRFADASIMQTVGVDEWLFTILIKIEPSYKILLDLFYDALAYYDKSAIIDLKFYGPDVPDVFEVKKVWCCPRLVSEKLYKFQDEMAKKYPTEVIAKRSRPTRYWWSNVFHEQVNE